MNVMLDTSVLVAAMVESHPAHDRAFPWLQRGLAGEFGYLVAAHTLAELYAVLTTLPVSPRLSPGTVWRMIHENVEREARVIPLSAADYAGVLKNMSERGLSGGAIYDALIARSAQKAGTRLLTLNIEDFRRVWPDADQRVTAP